MSSAVTPASSLNSSRRPSLSQSENTPRKIMNGHFASVGGSASREQYDQGIQVIDEDKIFNGQLSSYLKREHIIETGFNYHLISVFGSQSTGKSTLLNYLFGTRFGVMSQEDRRQTTKGIWMSKNKRTPNVESATNMAENILVMDVEGTDGRERGEDQDFERKAALFALATSEVLFVNMWEHQVGLYQGANMALLKTVFEVNLQLFVKDRKSIPRSLLFFVIRDHLGTTPMSNLRNTLLSDLNRIWASISKPAGLEDSKIDDYFDFAFVALPHKILQPERFEQEVEKLSTRFREGYKDPRKHMLMDEQDQPLLLPQYHRRIPADGFAVYAEGVWDQIVNNKDLDLPTQQELLAQFRCDEIAREATVQFDDAVTPLEQQQVESAREGTAALIPELGQTMNLARATVMKSFDTEASRYHKGVYQRKRSELEGSVDARLKSLFTGQLSAAQKLGVENFSASVGAAVKVGQKKGAHYDFAEIVESEKKSACGWFEQVAQSTAVEGTPWSGYTQQFNLFKKELDEVSKRLRQEEMRRLANRVERWVKTKLDESVGLQFNALGSGRGGSRAPESGNNLADEKDLWDNVWQIFTQTVSEAEKRFTDRARSYDGSAEEVEVGLWRLRRKSWGVLRSKIDEECMEGNLLMKLRENFEDRFRYDDQGVPRIWRPTDDIDGAFSRARDHTLTLIPLLSRFRLSSTNAPPPLDSWIGTPPPSITPADEEDLNPIGGIDEDEGKTLEDEMTILSDAKSSDLTHRFRKTADGVFVEAKRGTLGGVTQTPWWMWCLLLVLGQNEIFAVARNPLLILLICMLGAAAYVTYQMNLWGPIIRMSIAAWEQAVEIVREKLREFVEAGEGARRERIAMSGRSNGTEADAISLQSLDESGKRRVTARSRGFVEDEEQDDDFEE